MSSSAPVRSRSNGVAACSQDENVSTSTPGDKSLAEDALHHTPRSGEHSTPALKEVTNAGGSTGLTPTPMHDKALSMVYGTGENEADGDAFFCVNPLFSPVAESSKAKAPATDGPQREEWTGPPTEPTVEAQETPAENGSSSAECAGSGPRVDDIENDIAQKMNELSTCDSEPVVPVPSPANDE